MKKIANPICEMLIIGDEILRGMTLDLNSNIIAKALNNIGISANAISTVADNNQQIKEIIIQKSKNVEILIITGGLGPTPDDITRYAVSEALNKKLCLFPSLSQGLISKEKNKNSEEKKISI